MPVNTPHKEYVEALEGWCRVRDCYGGRDRVLAAGSRYVPDLVGLQDTTSKTTNADYRRRGSFYNAVSRTVTGMNGHIFQDPPKAVDVPSVSEDYIKDLTMTGVNLELFSIEAGGEIFQVSRYGILVEMAPDEGKRPYFVPYKAEDIVNWRTKRVGGDEILILVVLREEEEVMKDDFFTPECVTQYRALLLEEDGVYRQQLFREDPKKKGTYIEYEGRITPMRRNEPLTFIPFVFMGSTGITTCVEEPMMKDIADLNLAHWRNSVDFEYGLHLVALPTPWASGLKGVTDNDDLKIGPSTVWELELQGDAGMLEFTGKGLDAIEKAMDKKEKQMATLGARLLENAPDASETATGVRMRRSGDHASLRTVAAVLEEGLSMALRMLVWWDTLDKTPMDVKARVELNKDYLNIRATAQDVLAALSAVQAGEMSFETWFEFLRVGGWTPKDVDVLTEQKKIAEDKKRKEAEAPKPEPTPEPAPPTPGAPKVKKVNRDANGLITSIEES